MIPWVLAAMLQLQPSAPWLASYTETARGIAEGAEAEPVFAGDVRRTIALDIAVAWFESRFRPDAVGDHGAAHGLYQVHAPLAATVKQQTIEANRMMRASFKVCSRRPLLERLGWYASGGATCDRPGGLKASSHRMRLAERLFRTVGGDA